jgi:hypothetical protein
MDIERFKNYDEDYLLSQYEYKKQQSETRLIPFEFTKQQWLDFHKVLYSGVHCAYLNQEFVFKDKHPYFPTIERLVDEGNYSVENCVWVSCKANGIKDKLRKGNLDLNQFSAGEENVY